MYLPIYVVRHYVANCSTLANLSKYHETITTQTQVSGWVKLVVLYLLVQNQVIKTSKLDTKITLFPVEGKLFHTSGFMARKYGE